jgi:hypothetical protein
LATEEQKRANSVNFRGGAVVKDGAEQARNPLRSLHRKYFEQNATAHVQGIVKFNGINHFPVVIPRRARGDRQTNPIQTEPKT